MEYSDKMEAIKAKYEERILKVMNGLRDAIKESGYTTGEVFDMSCDEYQWALLVAGDKTLQQDDYNPSELSDEDIDVQFTIVESAEYDGTENGVTFAVNVNTVGGRILGGLTPYNYSDQVWVSIDDPEAIEERFAIFEQIDPEGIVDCLES